MAGVPVYEAQPGSRKYLGRSRAPSQENRQLNGLRCYQRIEGAHNFNRRFDAFEEKSCSYMEEEKM